jgi:segregation and condensation protein B
MMMLNKTQIKSIIESILFVSDEPVAVDRLSQIIEESDKNLIRESIEELKLDLEKDERGISLVEVAGGLHFRTKKSNSSWVFRLNKIKPSKLSRAAVETLSIIAYRQPITKQEIESIRGVDSGGTVKTLLEKGLIKIIGKKDEPGNPLLYSTTKEFLEFFNLKSLDDLPTLRDYHELALQESAAKSSEPEFEFDPEKKENPEEINAPKGDEK